MKIKQLQKITHKISKEKGFWNGTIVVEPEGVNPSFMFEDINYGEKLMLIVTELSEALEAIRSNNKQKKGGKWKKDTFEDELADALIRICDLAEACKINLEWQIKNKLEYNKKRPYKHGKKF